jgi:hypothetical protein
MGKGMFPSGEEFRKVNIEWHKYFLKTDVNYRIITALWYIEKYGKRKGKNEYIKYILSLFDE